MFKLEKEVDGELKTQTVRYAIDAAEYKKAGWNVVSSPVLKDSKGDVVTGDGGLPVMSKVPSSKDTARDVDKADVNGEKPKSAISKAVSAVKSAVKAETKPLTKTYMLEALKESGKPMHHATGDSKVKEAYQELLSNQSE